MRTSIAITAAVLALSGCSFRSDSNGGEPWQAAPQAPLSPRELPVGVWTGSEVLFVGGSDAPPCPPSADCGIPKVAPLKDGAAFDPQTGTWRKITDAPVGFSFAYTVLIDDTLYVWSPGERGRLSAPPAFLAYHVTADRWEQLPKPATDPQYISGLVRAGDGVVAFSGEDEAPEKADAIFDPATKTWSKLPDDPLPPGYDSLMQWREGELVLIKSESVDDVGSGGPEHSAAYDPETGAWRRLPEPTHEDGQYSRYDVMTADAPELAAFWSKLEHPPADQPDYGDGAFASGLITADGATYFAENGWVYDAAADRWVEIARLEDRDYNTVVAAGKTLVSFGGVRWGESLTYKHLNDAWTWTPPPPG